jgi:hypothetical protein
MELRLSGPAGHAQIYTPDFDFYDRLLERPFEDLSPYYFGFYY